MTFSDLPLKESLLKAISEMGYENPTPIQEKVIPLILQDDRDLIGLAETGSGKTAAYGLPLLNRIDPSQRIPQGLILAPTRELCQQIAREMEKFSRHMGDINLALIYGGAPFPPQISALKKGAQVIIATPGRLLDLITKGVARLESLRFLVLDEADVMLNMGFKDELDAILEAAPAERQSLLLSATMPPEVARIAKNYMTDPREISAGIKNRGTANVEHSCYMIHARDKYKALKRLVDSHPGIYGIIFCRTRASCQDIADRMIKEGYNTDSLHGDLSQAQRELVMGKFRKANLQLLVATDIAARGLDVDDLTHVIHYDLPDEIEVYNHRSGRTGRAGKKGLSFAIINMKEKYRIRKIEKVLGRPIEYKPVPTGREICEAQLMALIDRVQSVNVDEDEIAPYLSVIEEKLKGVDRTTLIHRFVSLEFNRFLNYYGKEDDLMSPSNNKSSTSPWEKKKGSPSPHGKTAVSLSLGKRDGMVPQQVIGLINQNCPGKRVNLGKITIGPSSTIIYTDAMGAELIQSGLKRVQFRGRRLKVKILESSGPKSSKKGDYQRKKGGKP